MMSKVVGIHTAILVGFLFFGASSPEASETHQVGSTGLSEIAEAATQTEKAPKISPVEPVFEFGEVRQGEKVEHVFQIRNAGTTDLIINKATGS
jgi:hypothetical protein